MFRDSCSSTIVPLLLEIKDKRFNALVAISSNSFAGLLAARYHYLHENELHYFNLLPAEKRQYSYLQGRYTAKKALCAYLKTSALTAIEIGYGVFFQPVIYTAAVRNTQVSIAHSGNKAAAVVFPEEIPMGIDLEEISALRNWDKLMPLTAAEERMALQLNYSSNEVLTLFWSVKEALSKAVKLGFTVDLSMYELATCQQVDGYLESTFTYFTQFKAFSWYANGFCWSVVVPGKVNVDVHWLIIQTSSITLGR